MYLACDGVELFDELDWFRARLFLVMKNSGETSKTLREMITTTRESGEIVRASVGLRHAKML